MGGLIFGLDAALIAGTVDAITKEFSLSSLELGTAVSAPAWGVLVALPFMGIICNNFGRKKAILLIAILYVVSAVASAFAPSYWVLVAARFLGGLAFSSISLASMYIGEIAPPKFRGKLVSMIQINIVIGLSGAYFINYLIFSWANSGADWTVSMGLADNTWRWMLGSEIPFALLWFFLLLGIPESPSWLFLRGRVEDAKVTLRNILPENQVEPHIAEMTASVQKSSKDHSILSQLLDLFSKRMRLIFVIAFALGIAQQTTGINAILFYAQTVFKQLGIGENAAFAQSVWVGLTSIVFTVLGLMLVDKFGRRPLIIWGMVWIIASLGVCSYAFKQARYTISQETIAEMSEVPNIEKLSAIAGIEYANDIAFKKAVKAALGEEGAAAHMAGLQQSSTEMNAVLVLIGILSFVAAFHFSVGPVMWVLFSEIFPISVRAIAIPFFTIITSVTSAVVQWFFPWQLDNMGMSSIFLFYGATVFVGLLVMFFTLMETKGMSIEEIEASYTNAG
ncbi:MFS transporter [Pelagicoccus sp. SDUM812005]|nr:MFS transporter [Pelagicoccus sp. SDUM812005]